MTITTGTKVAAATQTDLLMAQMFGMQPPLRFGRVIAQASLVDLDMSPDAPAEALDGLHAYVVEPLDADGQPYVETEQLAFLAGRHDVQDAELVATHSLTGEQFPVVTLVREVERSSFLASIERRIESEVEQAYSELDADLANLAASQDDDDEFFGRGTE